MQARNVESGVQLFSRIHQQFHSLEGINPKLFQEGPFGSEIIEIAGDFGKNLMLDFMIRCVLPTELNKDWKGLDVVFFNTDGHISILTITKIIDSYLKHFNIKQRKTIIETALSKIIILNCYSYEQLIVTFKKLEKIIRARENISLLIVDDISSHYWIAKESIIKLSVDHYTRRNLQILQDVTKNLNLVLIFSRNLLGNTNADLPIDYKITGEESALLPHKFVITDFAKKTSTTVPFNVKTFITFC